MNLEQAREIEEVLNRANKLNKELEQLKENYEIRYCTRCNTFKHTNQFFNGAKETMCKSCRSEYQKKKYEERKLKAKAYDELMAQMNNGK